MQIFNNSATYDPTAIAQATAAQADATTAQTGQDLPSQATTQASATTAASATPASQFASDTLSAMIAAQSASSSASDPSAASPSGGPGAARHHHHHHHHGGAPSATGSAPNASPDTGSAGEPAEASAAS